MRPPLISAEIHSPAIFCTLVAIGGYHAFKLVDGGTVATKYRNAIIDVDGKPIRPSFPHHSAGPLGDDIEGPWLTAARMMELLAYERLGWKDLHATLLPVDVQQDDIDPARYLPRLLMRALRRRLR